eukprot:CAMPEP_0182908660 /NCGR_PEP_ID=MMETSP0034_2-20130328/35329_1 /TAXON_ID=156128 /ORGANISM="Nephroselmis pyriformis, Strain CCMP717" /LENGTH=162 /DNA_ID=CAMNT_0025044851 /DNA_START=105 /DNA_END=588 /DNA_ORIENTATION=+
MASPPTPGGASGSGQPRAPKRRRADGGGDGEDEEGYPVGPVAREVAPEGTQVYVQGNVPDSLTCAVCFEVLREPVVIKGAQAVHAQLLPGVPGGKLGERAQVPDVPGEGAGEGEGGRRSDAQHTAPGRDSGPEGALQVRPGAGRRRAVGPRGWAVQRCAAAG